MGTAVGGSRGVACELVCPGVALFAEGTRAVAVCLPLPRPGRAACAGYASVCAKVCGGRTAMAWDDLSRATASGGTFSRHAVGVAGGRVQWSLHAWAGCGVAAKVVVGLARLGPALMRPGEREGGDAAGRKRLHIWGGLLGGEVILGIVCWVAPSEAGVRGGALAMVSE